MSRNVEFQFFRQLLVLLGFSAQSNSATKRSKNSKTDTTTLDGNQKEVDANMSEDEDETGEAKSVRDDSRKEAKVESEEIKHIPSFLLFSSHFSLSLSLPPSLPPSLLPSLPLSLFPVRGDNQKEANEAGEAMDELIDTISWEKVLTNVSGEGRREREKEKEKEKKMEVDVGVCEEKKFFDAAVLEVVFHCLVLLQTHSVYQVRLSQIHIFLLLEIFDFFITIAWIRYMYIHIVHMHTCIYMYIHV